MAKMRRRNITKLKVIFLLEIIVVLLVAFGIIEREGILVLLGILVFYILFNRLEDGVILFVASIPIFVALPISEGFDSLSSARIVIVILFLKWFFSKKEIIWENLKSLSFKKIFKNYRLEFLTIILFVIMALSIMNAVDVVSAIKKFIYLLNLIIIFPVIKAVIKNKKILKRIIKAVLISGGIVFLIALGQLISVYFFTIGDFWDWWASNFSLGFYGENLKQIVKNMNAWFAYSPMGPSIIRLFGSFTDPHSFALYLLLTLPFLIVFAPQLSGRGRGRVSWKELLLILFLFFIVLSGTRGIWISVVFGILAVIYLLIKRLNIDKIVSFILLILIIFISLIPISSVFTIIPQFKDQEIEDIDTVLLLKRLTSILDLDEASNQGRIYIWKKSLESLKHNFWLGIGIGNFPVILGQKVALAKAGSSAHNLYLNFAVESGIFAFIVIVLIVLEILLTLLFILRKNLLPNIRILITSIFIFLIWALGYSLFDIALLDERVFLLFLTILAMTYAIKTRINKYSNL